MRNINFTEGDGGQQHRYLYQNGVYTPTQDQYTNIRVPQYWELSYVEGLPGFGEPEHKTGRPESQIVYRPTFPFDYRFKSGDYAFKAFTQWRNHAMFLHQSFRVRLDSEYRWGIYAQAWYTRCSTRPQDGPYDSDCTTQIAWASDLFSVGIDPTGGKSPWAETVQWAGRVQVYGEYDATRLWSPKIQPQSEYITVFFRSVTSHPLKHNDVYLANAALMDEAPEPPPHQDCEAPAREPYVQIIHVYDPQQGREAYMSACATVWDEYGPQHIGPSSDAPFVGCGLGSKRGIWHHVTKADWPGYLDFADQYYPKVEIVMERRPFNDTPVPPPPVAPFELLSLHVQTEMDGWDDYYRRLHAHGRPCRWGKHVMGAESSNKVGPYLAEGALYRGVIEYGKYIDAATPEIGAKACLDTFWGAVVQNQYIAGVEGSNEMMGTSNTPDEIAQVVAFEIALSNEVLRRSAQLEAEQGRTVIAVLGNIPIGNLQHGAQTALIAPMVDTAIQNGHGVSYHPYYPATRDQALTRKWIQEEGYHHHLRAQTSWLQSLPNLAYARLFYTEFGAIHCTTRADNRPGDYRASNGWRHSECLNGDVDFYVETLITVRNQILAAPLGRNVECANIFTTGDPGVIKWHHFTFDAPVLDALATALERI